METTIKDVGLAASLLFQPVAGHDPGKLRENLPVGFLVCRVALQDSGVTREIALHTKQGEDKLLEIRSLALAESVSAADGIPGFRVILAPKQRHVPRPKNSATRWMISDTCSGAPAAESMFAIIFICDGR